MYNEGILRRITRDLEQMPFAIVCLKIVLVDTGFPDIADEFGGEINFSSLEDSNQSGFEDPV